MLFVWSGSLQGVPSETDDPVEAVEDVVRRLAPCVLGPAIRVTRSPDGRLRETDSFFGPPYEDEFPDLFNDPDLVVEVHSVEAR